MENTNVISIENLSMEELDVLNSRILNTKVNRLSENLLGFGKEIEIIRIEQEDLKNKLKATSDVLEETKKNYKDLKEATYVLSTDDGKQKELTKLIQKLTFQVTGGKNTIKDILFHRALVNACYKQLYNVFQINTYKRIKIDEFDISLKTIQKWFYNKQNIKKVISSKLGEYIALQDKNQLATDKSKSLDLYLEETEGGSNI